MMTAHHQIHIVFLNRIDQHLAQIAAAAQGFGDWIARVGGEFGQRLVSLFGDTLLHIAQIHVNQAGIEIGVINVHVN